MLNICKAFFEFLNTFELLDNSFLQHMHTSYEKGDFYERDTLEKYDGMGTVAPEKLKGFSSVCLFW